ncbi:MAG: helix-turn-helix domain-containing protein [Janthinobacterium lividum]
MEGLGDRLRVRARELGWSDTEVARRVGIGQTRYANYVTNRHEPDLATFARICSVLGASASAMLGQAASEPDEASRLRGQVATALEVLDETALTIVVAVVDGLVARGAQAVSVQPKPPGQRSISNKP